MDTYRSQLASFDTTSIPDLDVVVLGALELFATATLPTLDDLPTQNVLVIGSGNAYTVGQLLVTGDLVFHADESDYQAIFASHREAIKQAVIISASGGKHAIGIAKALTTAGIDTWLLTTAKDAPAAAYLPPEHVVIFPRNREPYTYNTSTYMGMLLSRGGEDAAALLQFIETNVAKSIPDTLGQYDAFCFIVPPELLSVKDMLITKFDELFGSRVSARVFTIEQLKHAKTVVPSDMECFISFGEDNALFGNPVARVHVILPEHAGVVAMIAIGYAVVGAIQRQHPPYFKDNIGDYVQKASAMFGHEITPIVE